MKVRVRTRGQVWTLKEAPRRKRNTGLPHTMSGGVQSERGGEQGLGGNNVTLLLLPFFCVCGKST